MSGAESKKRSLRTRSQSVAAKRAREQSAAAKFRVWYRHSGEEEIDRIPYDAELKVVTDYNEITTSIGSHHITHMCIRLGEVMPPIHVISPHLTHLRIDGVRGSHNLSCLETLSKLEELYIHGSYSNPPTLHTSALAVISQLSTLRVLMLVYCNLTDLPQSWKSLSKLEELYIWGSYSNPLTLDTSALVVISQLSTLRVLVLLNCNLTDLPQSFSNLQNLVKLDIRYNKMSGRLPRVLYQLSTLEQLDIQRNTDLVEIESDILKLHQLDVMNCEGCSSLQSPPYAVCKQGLPAIKKYFEDLIQAAGTEVTVVPVAVVGNLMAGKTSLIRSLKSGKREFTFRQESSPLDDTTEVFHVQTLALTDSTVRFIDFGGHEIYHLAYQLTLKDQCIATIVVNLEEYHKLSHERGANEATRRLCIDWLSHLYLACPRLGAPILVLTHRDKLSDEEFNLCRNQLLNSAEAIRRVLIEEEKELSEGGSEFCQIEHLSATGKPLFHSDDIFVFGNETDANTNLQRLKVCLERRSQEFKVTIPRSWELVNSYIDEQTSKAYLQLSDIKTEFAEDDQMQVILRYLHNSGRVLWFENKPTLSMYIFHQIPEIVNMITLLFHHSGDEKLMERIGNVTAFKHKNSTITKTFYKHLVEEFKEDGFMDEAILTQLLKTDTKFEIELALELLKSFHIIHGPIAHSRSSAYIIPYFSTKYMDRQWQSDGNIQLRAEIVFNGLPLPKYVFQLITVAVLGFRPDSTNLVKVANNGATIRHGESATHLVHDCNGSKVTLQVSTPVELIGSSWQRLIELTQHVVDSTTSVWKASHPDVMFYCAHCLFKRVDNPDFDINPSWFSPTSRTPLCSLGGSHLPSVTTFTGIEPVRCRHAEPNSNRMLTVPKPLRFPCYNLTTEAETKLNEYLSTLQRSHPPSRAGTQATNTESTDPQSTDPQVAGAQATNTQPTVTQATNEADSDLSDVEDEYLNFGNTDNVHIKLDLKPCTKQSVTSLYLNSDKVYQMADGVRGRVLILNNQLFSDRKQPRRPGASVDVANIKRLFEKLNFEIVKTEDDLTDLTAEEMLSEIQEETTLDVHHCYSMFVLVVSSHGNTNQRILSHDSKPVDLTAIKDLLSASKFPAMKGKPKLVIVQACSGEGMDYGDSRLSVAAVSAASTVEKDAPLDDVTPAASGGVTPTSADSGDVTPKLATSGDVIPTPAASGHVTPTPATSGHVAPTPATSGDVILDVDDFFIMKASTESYVSTRSRTHGSPFIRILVATFYRHSCHRDLESMFKIIQERVRKSSIKRRKFSHWEGGVVPEGKSTFTHYRKLYFFPKYPPSLESRQDDVERVNEEEDSLEVV